jgi:hypothetical protein
MCTKIQDCELPLFRTFFPNRIRSVCLLTIGHYEPFKMYSTILCIVTENARINPKTGLIDDRIMNYGVDPPNFVPKPKDQFSLPFGTDFAHSWVWGGRWTVAANSDIDGWSFSTKWTSTPEEWVTDLDQLPSNPRSGILARRSWVRVMRKLNTANYLQTLDQDNESSIQLEPPSPRKVNRSSRSNSLSSKIMGLVIGTPNRSTDPPNPETTDESEVDETFSTRALSLSTATPASSLYESQIDPVSDQLASAPQTAQGHRYTTSSSSNRSRTLSGVPLPSPVLRRRGTSQSGGSGNDGDGQPGPQRATWEPDESVQLCRVCNRRFTAFLRRHHCRYCGRVVCYRCSASRHLIPSERIVRNPFYGEYADDTEPRLHRVCDTCLPELERMIPTEPTSSEPNGSITTSPSQPIAEIPQIPTSDFDDRFLVECPVCRTDLRQFGDEDLQAIHVASCLEGQSSSPFTGGSRHVVYRLPEGSPLIGMECVICFEEFQVSCLVIMLT